MDNPILRQFLQTRQELIALEPSQKPHQRQKKEHHKTADGKAPYGEQDIYQLIEEKPPNKDVLKYFRKKAEALCEMH